MCIRDSLGCDGVLRVVCWDLGISTMVLHHIIGGNMTLYGRGFLWVMSMMGSPNSRVDVGASEDDGVMLDC